MKQSKGLWKSKQLGVIAIAVVLVAAAVAGLTIRTWQSTRKTFMTDGYILVPSDESFVTTDVNQQYYFASGAHYRERMGTTISFEDTSNREVKTDTEQYIHYADGSLGSFTKGVVMDVADVDGDQVTYYGVSKKTTLLKDGTQYSMSYLGDSLKIQEFVWKIADDTYMLVSPTVRLRLSDEIDVEMEDYVQLQYVEGGIVRLVHQQGTYQTISADAYLQTASGVRLDLVDRVFEVDGERTVSLDDMVIDSSDNLQVDEDEDVVKIPSFNVVNGENGASGADGTSGTSGEDGDEGGNGEGGTDGEEGALGESGYEGNGGESGVDGRAGNAGYDGDDGNSGDWGYDGKDGTSGTDAPNSTSTDGIAAVEQKQAPKVELETGNYTVGPNSVSMNLAIDDENDMLTSNLTWTIYNRDDYSIVTSGTISRGVTSALIKTDALQPDTSYVLVVNGDYSTDTGSYNTDFYTKVFQTDSLGVSITKVQVTDSLIKVQVEVGADALVSAYRIGLFDEDGNEVSRITGDSTASEEFTFTEGTNLIPNEALKSNTNYTVKVGNLRAQDGTMMGTDNVDVSVSKVLKTLKKTPFYYADANRTVTRDIVLTAPEVTVSDRYLTATVSLPSGIIDLDSGITGYRYELYTTSTTTPDTGAKPIATKEVTTLQDVTFDVEKNQNYYGRVVVIFADNEKEVELPSSYSEIVSIGETDYPTTKLDNFETRYDKVSGDITIVDSAGVVHVDADAPLTVMFASTAGDVVTLKLTTPTNQPDDNTRVYSFETSGLRRETIYTMTVTGYVDLEHKWEDAGSNKEEFANYHLYGQNFKTTVPTAIGVGWLRNATPSHNFEIYYSLIDTASTNSCAYEVGNLDSITFRLKKDGQQIGTDYVVKDTNVLNHASDFQAIYKSWNTDIERYYQDYGTTTQTAGLQNNNTTYMLTEDSFGLTNDSRVTGGGDFTIEVVEGYDYTELDKSVTMLPVKITNPNEMEWDNTNYTSTGGKNTAVYSFKLEQKHTASRDVNNAIKVTPIENQDAGTHKQTGLDDDTIVGFDISPDYGWEDAKTITYFIYDLTPDDYQAPLIYDTTTLYDGNWLDIDNLGNANANFHTPTYIKTVAVVGSAVTNGSGVKDWKVYFDDTDDSRADGVDAAAVSPYARKGTNCADDGNPIFQRGHSYFVRYEVTCDGSIGGETEYPKCVYGTDPYYYRSAVFSAERQTPVLYRYLNDTTFSGGKVAQEWMYLINDPDQAIVSERDTDTNTLRIHTPHLYEFIDYENAENFATGVEKKREVIDNTAEYTITDYDMASDPNLYDTGTAKWQTTYGAYSFSNLTPNYYTMLVVPYDKVTGVYGSVGETYSIPLKTPEQPGDKWDDADGKVIIQVASGGTTKSVGWEDQGSYRIKLTVRGEELYRVAALRVTLSESGKSLVFDPVPLSLNASGLTDNGLYYGYAYLDYAAIVNAGLADTNNVTMKVEAYYGTGEEGVKTFQEGTAQTDDNLKAYYFGSGAAADGAWAVKEYNTTFTAVGESVKQVHYDYVYVSSNALAYSGRLRTNGADIEGTPTMSGSVVVPSISDTLVNIGLVFDTDDTTKATLRFRYALQQMYNLQVTEGVITNKDKVIGNFEQQLVADETGLRVSGDSNKYYTVEKLGLHDVKIYDADNTFKDTIMINTGSGMPGVERDGGKSSVGFSTAEMYFNTKGLVPNATDKGIYFALYAGDSNTNGTRVPLTLCSYENNGTQYYFTANDNAMVADSTKLATINPDTNPANAPSVNILSGSTGGIPITYASGDAINGSVRFTIRGLDRNTSYFMTVYAMDANTQLQRLFDYSLEAVGQKYAFKTISSVDMTLNAPSFNYMNYNTKTGESTYGVNGNDGMNMRLFYKILDASNNEVRPDGISYTYVDGKGYLLEPNGVNIKYYDSVAANNDNKIQVPFTPGGVIQPNTAYKLELNAYEYVSGNYGDNIGTQTTSFTTPSTAAATATLRVVAGSTDLKVYVNLKDERRVVMNNSLTVKVTAADGTVIPSQTLGIPDSIGAATRQLEIVFDDAMGIKPNTTYTIEVTGDMDMNNDGAYGTGDQVLTARTSATTTSNAHATISTITNSDDTITFRLFDKVNFGDVTKIKYSIINNADGTNVETGEPSGTGWSESFTTTNKFGTGIYNYVIQYYNASGTLLGTDEGKFLK
ncbi:MAG: hypothetical protein IJ567_05310 [Lachnospiraceae bacterium]|nr:hypothetical protein [Lachnospiraceae bacterium]